MILFAYAGNMDYSAFAGNIPSAKKIGPAYLPGYTFSFNKDGEDLSAKANIMPSESSPGSKVWGVLMEIDDNEKGLFFNGDTWSSDFELQPVTCKTESEQEYAAEAFISKPHAVNDSQLPYDWYKERIIHLATLAGLPVEYIQSLESGISKPDPDVQRDQQRRAKTQAITNT